MNEQDLNAATEQLLQEMMAEHLEKFKADVAAQVRKQAGRVRFNAGVTQEDVNKACSFVAKAYVSAVMSNASMLYTLLADNNHNETLELLDRLRTGTIEIAEAERAGIKPSNSPWGEPR